MRETDSKLSSRRETESNSFWMISGKLQKNTAFCLLHLELSANPVDEELPAVFPRIHQSRAADLWPHAANDALHLVVWEQVRNLSLNE